MTTVDPEEVESLTGASSEPTRAREGVHERDFARPLRLGAGRLTAVRRRVEVGLFALSTGVSEALGQAHEVGLVSLREVHADVAREGLAAPLAATRFLVNGQIGWAVWDNAAAVRAVERLLCGSAPDEVERGLSALESDIVADVMRGIVEFVATAAEVEVTEHRPVRSLGTMGTWFESGEHADAHRVAFDLSLKAGDAQSELTIYLPGLAPAADDVERVPAALPNNLTDVRVALSARLGEIEIPLADLLALESGDVIPLGTPVDGTLAVTVDGTELARATLGTHRGKLAVRLTEIHQPGSQEPSAEASE